MLLDYNQLKSLLPGTKIFIDGTIHTITENRDFIITAYSDNPNHAECFAYRDYNFQLP